MKVASGTWPQILAACAVWVALAACSPRTAASEDLVHRVLPTERDLADQWTRTADDRFRDILPSSTTDSPACASLDEYFLTQATSPRVRASREFRSRDFRGLNALVYAEDAETASVLPAYLSDLEEYFSEPDFGQCSADYFSRKAKDGPKVVPFLVDPVAHGAPEGSVAWEFRLSGEPLILRYEVYFWHSGSLFLLLQAWGGTGDISRGAADELLAEFQEKAQRELAKGR